MTKKGSSFDMRVVIHIGGGLALESFVIGGVFMRDVVRTFYIFYFLFILDTLFLYIGLVTT